MTTDSTLLTKKECEWLLERAAQHRRLRLISYNQKPLADHPVGFLGDHYRLTLRCTEEILGKRFKSVMSFFVKTVPRVPAHSRYVEEIGVFEKESSLFRTLIPEMQEMTSFMEYPWSPKCYLAKNTLLVMQDLSLGSYRQAPGRGMFDMDHCKYAVEALAKFHAASVIWEKVRKVKIDTKFAEPLKEATYVHTPGHSRSAWLSSAIDALVFLCEIIRRDEESKLVPSLIGEAVAKVGPSPDSLNVVSHGDLWGSNFMFQYDDENSVVNCVLVDFQLARYSPCALDLMCCLHLVTTKNFRDQNFARLVSIYHEKFHGVLTEYGLDAAAILTKDKLLEDCKYYKQLALAEACLFGISIWLPPVVVGESLSDPSKCVDLVTGDRTGIVGKAFIDDAFYRNQLTDLICELLDTSK